jgi:hypothetical protein
MALVQFLDLAHLAVKHLPPKGKRNHQEVVLTEIQQLTRKLSDSADEIQSETERAISRLISPSPTFSDFSVPALYFCHTSANSYGLCKKK